MSGSMAYRAMKAAIQVMDRDELKDCVTLAQKILGEKGYITATSAKGKKSPVYMRVVKGYDPSIRNGYSITGNFVNGGNISKRAMVGDTMLAHARGAGGESVIMVGKYAPLASHAFAYPSGASGSLLNMTVSFTTDDWGRAHDYLDRIGIPNVKAVTPRPPKTADDDEVEVA